jgi:hypothetical protein
VIGIASVASDDSNLIATNTPVIAVIPVILFPPNRGAAATGSQSVGDPRVTFWLHRPLLRVEFHR